MRAYHLGKRWVLAGHAVTVFLASNHHLRQSQITEPSLIDGVEYVPLKTRPYSGNGFGRILNMLDYCQGMHSLKRPEQPDVVIASSPHPFSIFPARTIAQRSGARLVFEVRDLWPLSIIEIAGASPRHPFVQAVGFAERYAYRHADMVASLLGGAEPYMRAKGLDRGKFFHLPNGIALDEAGPVPPTSAAGIQAWEWMQAEQENGRKVIIHPGSQGVPNALDRLVEAMRLIPDTPASCVLVGGGSETEKLKQASAGLPVSFFPPVPRNDALWLTAHADVGYAGGRDLPIYRFGSSLNKVADFVRFHIPFVEVIPSGAGIRTDGDSPRAIAHALREALKAGTFALPRPELNYDAIAARYLWGIS